ncbi:MAG: hypothetical protein RJA20_873 [Bacteroidota bacterium]|jgi:hypothetical protein
MKYLIVSTIISGVVMLIWLFPHTMLSPGELLQGHQSLNNDCFACHTPFGGLPDSKCVSCHTPADIEQNESVHFHEKFVNISCVSCHADHLGMASASDNFKHNIIPGNLLSDCFMCHQRPEDYLHHRVTASCSACHGTDDWKGAVFNHNQLSAGDLNTCISCHQKPSDKLHASQTMNCDRCHSTDQWSPATFEHADYFVLDSDHNISCDICHVGNDYESYTCYGCHEHNRADILNEHREEGISNIKDCVRCHKSPDETGEEDGERHSKKGIQRDDED